MLQTSEAACSAPPDGVDSRRASGAYGGGSEPLRAQLRLWGLPLMRAAPALLHGCTSSQTKLFALKASGLGALDHL